MDDDLISFLERIEEILIKKNIYIDIVKEIMNFLAKKVVLKKSITKKDIVEILFLYIKNIMTQHTKTFLIDENKKPYVIIMCGVNGSGKTTTIGKMVNILKNLNWSITVAACDTYRPAAKEQLQSLLSNNIVDDFIFNEKGKEKPTQIALKALKVAREKNKDIVIIDTAGRIQNNQNLMAELLKMKQKIKEQIVGAPHEILLIIDANCGYNAIQQAQMYNDLLGITGIIVTKVDISNGLGTVLSICKLLNIPIYGITNGEKDGDINDLDPEQFTYTLLGELIDDTI